MKMWCKVFKSDGKVDANADPGIADSFILTYKFFQTCLPWESDSSTRWVTRTENHGPAPASLTSETTANQYIKQLLIHRLYLEQLSFQEVVKIYIMALI